MNMNKQEVVAAIASAVGTTNGAAGGTLDAFLAVVTQAVAEGDGVQLVDFGG
jgi:DNA-binding protein HU-beta